VARPAGSNAVEKTLAVLDALGDHERIADIVTATGLHKSTVHRILQDFARLGFVRVTERGTYEGGPRILRLAGRVLARTDAAERAAPELHALQERCGGTVHFAVLDGDEAVYVAKVEGNKPYRMASRIGMAVPLHCTAIGKAALAALPEDEVRALLRRAPPRARTPATIAAADDPRPRPWGMRFMHVNASPDGWPPSSSNAARIARTTRCDSSRCTSAPSPGTRKRCPSPDSIHSMYCARRRSQEVSGSRSG